MDATQKPSSASSLLNALEADLHDLLSGLPTQPQRLGQPGAPPVLPAFLFWAALLVCVLRGFSAQQSLWRLVCLHGLWDYPRLPLTRQAIYQRLARAPGTALMDWFSRITLVVRERFAEACDVPYAAFATEILALDHSTLDAVLRKLKLLRAVPRGAAQLIPGDFNGDGRMDVLIYRPSDGFFALWYGQATLGPDFLYQAGRLTITGAQLIARPQ